MTDPVRDKTSAGYGTVTDYSTGEPVRPATREEWLRTRGPRPRGRGDATGSWADDDGRLVYVNCGEGCDISMDTIRPDGATGVHWTAHGIVLCFAKMDTDSPAWRDAGVPGEFVFDPALTGEHDDCACDWHTWLRRREREARAAPPLN